MTRAKAGKGSPLKVLVTILAIIVVILFTSAGFRISEHSQGYSYEYSIRDYLFDAEYGRFGDLYDTAVRDMGKHTTYSAEVAECRALGFYYEQAVLEHAYRASGDTAKADEFAQRMKEYEAQLGSMSSRAEAVRASVSG